MEETQQSSSPLLFILAPAIAIGGITAFLADAQTGAFLGIVVSLLMAIGYGIYALIYGVSSRKSAHRQITEFLASEEASESDARKLHATQSLLSSKNKSIASWVLFVFTVLAFILFWPIGIILLLVWLFRVLR